MSTTNLFPVLLSVDISETDSSYLVETDISHFHADDVFVDVWQDSLIIEMKAFQKTNSVAHPEFDNCKRFRRVIPLGITMRREELTSEFNDGNLAIRINKMSIAAR